MADLNNTASAARPRAPSSSTVSGPTPNPRLSMLSSVVQRFPVPVMNAPTSSAGFSIPRETPGTARAPGAVPQPEPQPRMSFRAGSGNAIIVSERQRGNPVLQSIRNVPWEYGNTAADYQMGISTCALFLSLKYHNLNPEYIHERLKILGQKYDLRVLLVLIDVKDPHHPLKELAKTTLLADVTLIPAWSPEDCAKYLELYKIYENKPADMIKAQVEGEYMPQLTAALTTVKSVNKTDAKILSSTYKSFNAMTQVSKEELSLLPGFGVHKAKRLHDVFHQPFVKRHAGERYRSVLLPTSSQINEEDADE